MRLVKLSMRILADKLNRFTPEVSATTGKMDIGGVRPLTAGTALRDDMLYIAPAETDAQGVKSVLCTHGSEWMRLHAEDADSALAAILDVFESFNLWRSELEEAARQGSPVQRFLDISSYALPFPIVITDPFGTAVGLSQSFLDEDVDQYWTDVVKNRNVHGVVFNSTLYDSNGRSAENWGGEPRIFTTPHNHILGCLLQVNGEMVGSMTIIEYRRTLSEGTCQLAQVLRDAVATALNLRGENAELRTVMHTAADYLSGRSVDSDRLWEQVTRYTRRSDEELELLLLRDVHRSNQTYLNSLAYRLTNGGLPCFGLVLRRDAAAIICCAREQELLSQLREQMPGGEFLCGVSLPFTDKEGMQRAGNQATLALMSGPQTPGSVSRCVDHAYTYLISKLAGDRSFGTELLHPGPGRLKKYDEKHNTQFYTTLYVYLLHERNVVATARALFIHRNSMIYRLQRIRELLDVDLDDPKMRMYLLLSYQILEAQSDRSTADLFEGDTPGAREGKQMFWAEVSE